MKSKKKLIHLLKTYEICFIESKQESNDVWAPSTMKHTWYIDHFFLPIITNNNKATTEKTNEEMSRKNKSLI